jgi:transposase-like protein
MGKGRDPEKVVREIKRKTRRRSSTEEKIRIVLKGLRGEDTVATLCLSEEISPNLCYNWSKEFLGLSTTSPGGNPARPGVPGSPASKGTTPHEPGRVELTLFWPDTWGRIRDHG